MSRMKSSAAQNIPPATVQVSASGSTAKVFSANQAAFALAAALVSAGWYAKAQVDKLSASVDRIMVQMVTDHRFVEHQFLAAGEKFVAVEKKITSESSRFDDKLKGLDDKIKGLKEQISGTDAEIVKIRELVTELRIGMAIAGSEKPRR